VKIFHILTYALHGAGNVCAAIDLACEQAAQGHQVYVCSSVTDFRELLDRNGVETIVVKQLKETRMVAAGLLRLQRVLRDIKPDIVHAHMIKSALIVAALRPFNRYRLVTTVHNEFQRNAILMNLGERVICVSAAVTSSMIRRGIPRSRIRTVLNGTINSARRPQPTPPPLSLRRPAVASICGMHPRKGIPDLIEAFGSVLGRFPTAHLYLVGSGPCAEAYRRQADNVSVDQITFLGHLDDPRPVLLGADIFVLASHQEPAGLVLSEAREAGCAIVATEVGGIPEMLDQGNAGTLVPSRRPDLLGAAIIDLLLDPARLALMRERAQVGLEKFTMQRVASETEDVYRELLGD
jgi:glycosyltransferase involved in cell wall biosynthesis